MAEEKLILDETAYCHSYYVWGMDRIDPVDEATWTHYAMMNFEGLQYGDRSRADTWAETPASPADWMNRGSYGLMTHYLSAALKAKEK